MEGNEPQFTLLDSLDDYIADHCPEGLSGADCYEAVRKAGHAPIVDAVVRVLFARVVPKKRLVWIAGPRNIGKSSFINMMKEIFVTQEFNFDGPYCCMDPPDKENGKNWAVQLYISPEFDVKQAFVGKHYASMKSIFEGAGAQVETGKYIPHGRKMVDGLFIVASNELPMAEDTDHIAHRTEWLPFMARCDLVRLDGAGIVYTHDFPYDTSVLAKAIQHSIYNVDHLAREKDDDAEEEKDPHPVVEVVEEEPEIKDQESVVSSCNGEPGSQFTDRHQEKKFPSGDLDSQPPTNQIVAPET